MFVKIAAFLLVFLFSICSIHAQQKGHKLNNDLIDNTDSESVAGQLYFPAGMIDYFSNTWYSRELNTLKEPKLPDDTCNGEDEVYRFSWMPGLVMGAVAVRIEKRGAKYMMYWKESKGDEASQPNVLVIDKRKEIDKNVWEEFKLKLAGISFWSMKPMPDVLGCDGEEWILEGKTATKYFVMDSWSPKKREPAYYDCCRFLIKLSGMRI